MPQLPSRIALCLLALLALPRAALAHPIDEVKGNAVVDLRTQDRRDFALSLIFEKRHLESYTRIVRELGLAPERDREELARTVQSAFTFAPCSVTPPAQGPRFSDEAGGAFVALHFDLHCPQPMESLTLSRVSWRQDRTRTTLYVRLQVGADPALQLLIPPHMASMTMPLQPGVALTTKAEGQRVRPAPRDTAQGALPSDAKPIRDFPSLDPSQPKDQVPPRAILQAWAREGMLHLLTGPDHLLFLLTLVIGAAAFRTLLIGVTAFSLGHLTAMATALLLHWPPVPFLDVIIGATIAASAWRARRPQAQRSAAVAGLAIAFGLIHGLGFGAGLQALTGGTGQILWPLLSFGLGLDLAQTAWVLLAWSIWLGLRRLAPRVPALGTTRLQTAAASLLVCAGLGAAALAALQGR